MPRGGCLGGCWGLAWTLAWGLAWTLAWGLARTLAGAGSASKEASGAPAAPLAAAADRRTTGISRQIAPAIRIRARSSPSGGIWRPNPFRLCDLAQNSPFVAPGPPRAGGRLARPPRGRRRILFDAPFRDRPERIRARRTPATPSPAPARPPAALRRSARAPGTRTPRRTPRRCTRGPRSAPR